MKVIISEDSLHGAVRQYETTDGVTQEGIIKVLGSGGPDLNALTISLKDGGVLVIGVELLRKSIIEFKS